MVKDNPVALLNRSAVVHGFVIQINEYSGVRTLTLLKTHFEKHSGRS